MYYRIWINYKKLTQAKNSTVKNTLDRVFSQWIRRKAADENGWATCFTCGRPKPWFQLQNGHYVKRENMCTRYHPENNHPQCENCNVFLRGNLKVYAQKLDERYGEGTAEKLEALGKQTCKIHRNEMIELIRKLDKEIGEMIDGKRS